jgi:hypothetical protein
LEPSVERCIEIINKIMNIFTYRNVVTGRIFAVLTAVSMILSALPAHVFVAEAAPAPVVLFADDFESADFTSAPYGSWSVGSSWTSTSSDSTGPGTYSARGVGDSPLSAFLGRTPNAIDTTGFENITLSFDYKLLPGFGNNIYYDKFNVNMGGATTSVFYTAVESFNGDDGTGVWKHAIVSTSTVTHSGTVYPTADNPAFRVAFSIFSDTVTPGATNTNKVLLDNVIVTGTPITAPACTPQFNVATTTAVQNLSTGEYFNSLQDAIDDCDTVDGDTVNFTADMTITEQVTVSKELTIEGNGNSIIPTFTKTTNSNNAAIGIIATDAVVLQNFTIEGAGGTDLHGVNVYESTGIRLLGLTINDSDHSAVVVNGSEMVIKNITTSGSGWHAINVSQGVGVTAPAVLTIRNTSAHAETSPSPTPHIFVDNNTYDVTIVDTDSQYDMITVPIPFDTQSPAGIILIPADIYTLKTPAPTSSLTITTPVSDNEVLTPSVYTFEAEYVDADDTQDAMRWAIRPGCTSGTNLAGNVGGLSSTSTYDGAHFEADVDMSTWADGDYCFVVNPAESGGHEDLRELRPFTLETPVASLIITDPVADYDVLAGTHTFKAEYTDDDPVVDHINWAIRAGTCAANTNTVAGNVDGFNDAWDFTGIDFSTTVDMSTWANGNYCFVVNPSEGSGETDLRETRWFTLENTAPVACEAGVNLFENPSFEEPVVTASRKWDILPSVGWIVKAIPGNAITGMELQRGVFGWLSSDGEQHTELDTTQKVRVKQKIDTIPGQEYTLTWDYAARPGTSQPESKMFVRINGHNVAINNEAAGVGPITWLPQSYTFTASSTHANVAFVSGGTSNGRGALLDNTSFTCNPELVVATGPYCGDGEINQDWEQCEIGDEGCTDYCVLDNQCTDLRLVKINLNPSDSVSFDDTVYLGNATNPLPSGTWFNFDEAGDSPMNVIGNSVDGLAVSRDIATGKLLLGFVGGNSSHDLDLAIGSIETLGINLGSIDRNPITQWKLEDGTGGSFLDVFAKSGNIINFDLRADTGRDGVSVEIGALDEPYNCPAPEETNQIEHNYGGRISRGPVGQVLGASTSNQCPLLLDFMQIGAENNPWEVKKLQSFLNIFVAPNPVTGFFGKITDKNVKKFQEQYKDDVLLPWFEKGIVSNTNPTGFVYKTTLWKINSIVCSDYTDLPNFEGEDLTKNVDID